MPQVVSDAGLAIIAGSDTTSTAIANLFWLLLSNPPAYSLLQREVDKYFPSGESTFETTKFADMPYLNAVMQVFPLFL
jgi:cytochrome P450